MIEEIRSLFDSMSENFVSFITADLADQPGDDPENVDHESAAFLKEIGVPEGEDFIEAVFLAVPGDYEISRAFAFSLATLYHTPPKISVVKEVAANALKDAFYASSALEIAEEAVGEAILAFSGSGDFALKSKIDWDSTRFQESIKIILRLLAAMFQILPDWFSASITGAEPRSYFPFTPIEGEESDD